MSQVFLNNFTTTLHGSMTASTTTLTIVDGSLQNLLGTSSDNVFAIATITDFTSIEIVKITHYSTSVPGGYVFVVERAQEGTSAGIWAVGTQVEIRITAGFLEKISPVADAHVPNLSRYNGFSLSPFQGTSLGGSYTGMLPYIGSTTNRDNNWYVIPAEPGTPDVSSKVSTILEGYLYLIAYGTPSGTTRSLMGVNVEIQIKRPATSDIINPVIGTIYRDSSNDFQYERVYYYVGDVTHALRIDMFIELENPPTGGIREQVVGYYYDASANKTYVMCNVYSGVALTSTNVSTVDSIWYGVATGGYRTYTYTITQSRYMGSYTTYHQAPLKLDLGINNQELEIRIKGKKSTTSTINASSITIDDNSCFYVTRG